MTAKAAKPSAKAAAKAPKPAAKPAAKAARTKAAQPLVGILMGSSSDLDVMNEAAKILEELGIAHEVVVTSAHRSPRKTADYAASAADRGLKVLIVAAGLAAHLAGAVAAATTLPVLGVPLDSGSLRGMDALLSTVMMPAGVPVGTLAIGTAGSRNAALLAAQILALSDARLARALVERKRTMADAVPGLVRRWPGNS
ncbi:MAG TPA: 5-(carboxyamino)imidazole ribonucleotide mutase [Candidatus Limnocylindrales bacterium]|nr:5-(carboxyamino)imidazole ribonucleotide mutase [Candidatus Limnocylindrales bacterium]